MTEINSPDQLPQFMTELHRSRFYGDIQITFRDGHISRIVTEESTVFNPAPRGGNNGYYNR